MSRSSCVLLILALQVCLLVAQTPKIKSYIETSQRDLKQLFDTKDLDVEKIYKALHILTTLQTEETLLRNDQVSRLRQFVPKTQAEAFYLSEIAAISHDSKIELNREEVKSFFKGGDSSLDSLYFTHFYLRRNGNNKDNAVCDNLKDYLNEDGTAKSSKKDPQNNYQNTALLLELYNSCLESNKEQKNTFLKQLRKPVQSILINTQEIGFDQLAFLEKVQTIQITASLTRALFTLTEGLDEEFASNFRKNYLVQLLKFVRENEELTDSIYQRFEITRLYETLKNFPFVEVRQHPVLITKRTAEILLSVGNLFGNFVGDQGQIIQSLKVQLQDRQGQNLEVESKIEKNEKSTEFNFKIVFPKGIDVVGTYTLVLHQNGNKNQQLYRQQSRVIFVTQARFTSLQFEVVKGRVFPTSFSNRLKEGENVKETIQLNENNFVHINFKIETEKVTELIPSQVGLSILHPNNKYTTNFIPASYDKQKDTWTVVLDLGDPDQILPYTNIYDAQVVVADRYLRDPVTWNFAKFHIKFKKMRQNPPPSDLDYEVLPEIKHIFPAPIQQPPIYFIGFFLIMLFTSFIYFWNQLKKLNINTLRIPDNYDQKLVVYIFIAALGVMLGLLAYFWLYINIIQTFKILAVLVLPFFFLGNYAISSLKKVD